MLCIRIVKYCIENLIINFSAPDCLSQFDYNIYNSGKILLYTVDSICAYLGWYYIETVSLAPIYEKKIASALLDSNNSVDRLQDSNETVFEFYLVL